MEGARERGRWARESKSGGENVRGSAFCYHDYRKERNTALLSFETYNNK